MKRRKTRAAESPSDRGVVAGLDDQPSPAASRRPGDADDLIGDILRRVRAAGDFTDDELQRIEQEVRRDWGGERPYIAKHGEHTKAIESARDECIRRDHRRGEPVKLLTRRYGLSKQRIYQILGLSYRAA